MKTVDAIIIGGGAAGLFCALTAARRGAKILLLEKNDHCGKKLSQTGNGRCNYTNSAMSPDAYESDSPDTVAAVLEAFGWQDTVSAFENIGIVPFFREGYCYPASGEARSFADLLAAAAEDAGAEILTSRTVTGIEKTGSGFRVSTIETKEVKRKKGPSGRKKSAAEKKAEAAKTPSAGTREEDRRKSFFCRQLVLAAGGAAAPKTGSSGDSFSFLKSLGLPLEDPLPALVPLHLGSPYREDLFGIRARGKAAVFLGEDLLAEDSGEIQFTKEGLSGIPAMNISSRAVRALAAGKKAELSLNLFPEGLTAETVFSIVKRSGAERPLSFALTGLLPYRAVPFFLDRAGCRREDAVSVFQKADAERLCRVLTGLSFPVTGYADFDRAQVTSGGLPLYCISAGTCEVKGQPGLYTIGEALNCSGRCGGYNLQWAFATGFLAGEALKGTACLPSDR